MYEPLYRHDNSDYMDIIDDDGRLFGAVNVIDALVVLLVAAVIIAGAAFILAPSAPEDTRYATVDFGEQPSHITSQLEEGDTMEMEASSDNMTIVDTYVGPNGHTLARVLVRGESVEIREGVNQFQFAGEPFRAGQSLEFETLDYVVTGDVTHVASGGETLEQSEYDVIAVASMSGNAADAIEEGVAYTVSGHEVATVESTLVYPGGDGDYTTLIGLSLSTYEHEGVAHYGPDPVRLGGNVSFDAGQYEFDANILSLHGNVETESEEVVVEAVVPRSTANQIAVGDTHGIGDDAVATVEDVNIYPTPDRGMMRVQLGLEVRTWQDGGQIMYGSNELRRGTAIDVDTDTYGFSSQVIQRGSLELPGEERTVTVTLQKQDVLPERADRITSGMTERLAGQELAVLGEREVAPAETILTSEDGEIFSREHPRNVDLTFEAELTVIETETGLLFHGEEIREGDSVVLDLNRAFVEMELIEIHG